MVGSHGNMSLQLVFPQQRSLVASTDNSTGFMYNVLSKLGSFYSTLSWEYKGWFLVQVDIYFLK